MLPSQLLTDVNREIKNKQINNEINKSYTHNYLKAKYMYSFYI
jgi:hypothetical protein